MTNIKNVIILVIPSSTFFLLINTCQADAIHLMLNMRWLKKQLLMIGLVFEQQKHVFAILYVSTSPIHLIIKHTHSVTYQKSTNGRISAIS